MGTTKQGPFDIEHETAQGWLHEPNPHGLPNSDVLVPWVNGRDITQRSRWMWIIDCCELSEEKAALYEAPFTYMDNGVRQQREDNPRSWYREEWWRLYAERPGMRQALNPLHRFIATPRVSKHRVFSWLVPPTLPDCQLIIFPRSDDYFMAVLHSWVHETWARAQGTQLREVESGFRYTPTTCFETFPFPWPPGEEPQGDPAVEAIGEAAREVNELRENWLNPPEWTLSETLEFPGSVDGPWARYVEEHDRRGIGTVRYERTVPDPPFADDLKKRTLTNLYNENPAWLQDAHRRLDEAVCAAYARTTADPSWSPDMDDEAILEKLLELNLERAAAEVER